MTLGLTAPYCAEQAETVVQISILSMLSTTSVIICNRLSSAAAVLLPKGLCAARPAGVPPRRRGALLTHPVRIIMARPESGFVKDDLHVRMQIELRRDF